jgi:hypothetical protein
MAEVAGSVEELIAGATERTPLVADDGKSGAQLEWVVIDGERFVVKTLDLRTDWTMRAAGDLGGNVLTMWRRGLFERMPECINQPIVAVAHDPSTGPGGKGTTLLMRDVSRWLVPPGDDAIPLDQELSLVDHMAAMHAAFWNAGDEIELVPMGNRYLILSPGMAETEEAIGSDSFIPPLVRRGWAELEIVAPRLADIVVPLTSDPWPLIEAYGAGPTTLLHGNWKLGNLGTDDEGRSVVIDWEDPGRGPGTIDLAWYLAINAARLPHSKDDAMSAYRAGLERRGIDTEPWWERHMGLALVGAMVHFGWEKALGGPGPELDWWQDRVLACAPLLGISGR